MPTTDDEIVSEAMQEFESPDPVLDDDTFDDLSASSDALTPSTADKLDDALAEEPEPTEDAADNPAPVAEEIATPLTYVTDGQQKAFEGIKIVAGPDGQPAKAIVDLAALPEITKRLSRHDHYEAANQALYGKVQQYDGLEFAAGDGTVHKGMAAFEQAITDNAKLVAATRVFASVIEDPEKAIAIANAHISGDQAELQRLLRDVKQEVRDAEWTARQGFQKRITDATQQQETASQREQITRDSIQNSITQWAQQFPALTPEDTQQAFSYLSRLGTAIVRQASPEEARTAGVRPGDLIIDHQVVHEYLKGRAEMRQQAAQAADAARKAQQENATRLAAANRTNGKPQRPTRSAAPRSPAPQKREPTYSEIKRAALNGHFLTDVVGDADDE